MNRRELLKAIPAVAVALTIDWKRNAKQLVTLDKPETKLKFRSPRKTRQLVLTLVQGEPSSKVIWPKEIKWLGGIEPKLSVQKGSYDIITLSKYSRSRNYLAKHSQI